MLKEKVRYQTGLKNKQKNSLLKLPCHIVIEKSKLMKQGNFHSGARKQVCMCAWRKRSKSVSRFHHLVPSECAPCSHSAKVLCFASLFDKSIHVMETTH